MLKHGATVISETIIDIPNKAFPGYKEKWFKKIFF